MLQLSALNRGPCPRKGTNSGSSESDELLKKFFGYFYGEFDSKKHDAEIYEKLFEEKIVFVCNKNKLTLAYQQDQSPQRALQVNPCSVEF